MGVNESTLEWIESYLIPKWILGLLYDPNPAANSASVVREDTLVLSNHEFFLSWFFVIHF